ncbi:unnamed protein product [Linum trigynum]|uniref:Uncharacterized protein n=1 Tax=Linum trigynum TaxID=586398 RepID=A0AAV2FFR1_9ROSI
MQSSILARPTSKTSFVEMCTLLESSSSSWYQPFGVLLKSTTPVPPVQLSDEPPMSFYELPMAILTSYLASGHLDYSNTTHRSLVPSLLFHSLVFPLKAFRPFMAVVK